MNESEKLEREWLQQVAALLGEVDLPESWKRRALAYRDQGFGVVSAATKMRHWLEGPR